MFLPGRGTAPDGFSGPLILTEADCGFCQKSVATLRRFFPGDWVAVDNHSVDVSAFGLTQQDIIDASWWVESVPSGIRTYGGAKNFGALLIRRGWLWAALGLLAFIPPFSWIAAGVYRLIADNRGRMPGATPSCGVPPTPKP